MVKVFLPAILLAVMVIVTGFSLMLTQAENKKLEQGRNELMLKNDSLHIQQLEASMRMASANMKIDSLLKNKK